MMRVNVVIIKASDMVTAILSNYERKAHKLFHRKYSVIGIMNAKRTGSYYTEGYLYIDRHFH